MECPISRMTVNASAPDSPGVESRTYAVTNEAPSLQHLKQLPNARMLMPEVTVRPRRSVPEGEMRNPSLRVRDLEHGYYPFAERHVAGLLTLALPDKTVR